MSKLQNKISYKQQEETTETYIVAALRSLFASKASHSKSVYSYFDLFEKDKNVVKVELAAVKHPWPTETIENTNSSHFLNHRKYE